ncbi:2-dehydropantoate 2-reductase [Microbacterium sp. CPCC 204701]|uniref:2-dehydropantoate 2-reductase n=1 Tax=Microbacterium sp. CPCC 204701 TaxID=2493084 RepID=UPI000FD79B4A|nr:2-dehydropantoate 2-reductase [Microbacterium sp. CPCC 204701]
MAIDSPAPPTRITVIGAGAVGAAVAVRLALDPRNKVTVAVRTPVERLVVVADGARLEVSPAIISDPAQGRLSEWILVATKAYDAATAATWFPALVGASTIVAVLQNGVEHAERFEGSVPTDRVLPVVVDLPASRTTPGHVVQHRRGRLTVPLSDSGSAFVELFAQSGLDVTATADFTTAAWEKLCVNSVGALTAVTAAASLSPDNAATAGLVRALVAETAAVGRAEGARIDAAAEERIVRSLLSAPLGSNSLADDRRAGRRLEVDARNGAVVRIGQRHGLPTPVNRVIVELLRSVEPAHRAPRGLLER